MCKKYKTENVDILLAVIIKLYTDKSICQALCYREIYFQFWSKWLQILKWEHPELVIFIKTMK